MLLDKYAPHPHFVETHSIDVAVSADEAYRALWATDFGTSSVIRALWILRTLPSRLFQGKTPPGVGRNLNLRMIFDCGFGRLAESPGREIILGLAGRFWRPVGNLEPFRPEYFT